MSRFSIRRLIRKTSHDKDGILLPENEHVMWCDVVNVWDFHFLGAQHAALAVGGSVQPCKKCVKGIIDELRKEL